MATSERELPEPIIHHIQSFMTGKEAARTILVSKSWYKAWLTRHALDFSIVDFNCTRTRFATFTTDTLQRYQDLNLKIHTFRLQLCSRLPKRCDVDELLIRSLVATAIEIGATDLDLMLNELMVPPEVLASETLVRLSLKSCEINGSYRVRCSNLTSLKLEYICFEGDDVLLFRNIISCCVLIEELSLFMCRGLTLNRMSSLQKLRRLLLFRMEVDGVFFNDFASRFPCLNHLSIVECDFNGRMHICSPSLQHICLKGGHSKAVFDVPNIQKFTYGFTTLRSSLSIEESASKDWEFDISITSSRLEATPWFLKLKKFLSEFEKRSRISLSVSVRVPNDQSERDVFIQVVPEPIVVENLTIDEVPSFASCCALLARLFGICRPKFLTSYGRTLRCHGRRSRDDETLRIICKVMNQNMLGQFGLKVENTELYEQFRVGWRPVVLGWRPLELTEPLEAALASVNSPQVRFRLKWDDWDDTGQDLCRINDEQLKELVEGINQTPGGRMDYKQPPKRNCLKPVRLRD